ncbi:hypothetical protein O181_016932 [Austropuccinia psidii MF-1]|uniref:Uncharacterized protein n=1 Tax=Austropuccinia psidii MF-1 TaxID=1389203 RepID=A0A9Q3C4Z5_9BASI|nr:hypothetical protein [Austropuccinia psidii MF-1]
MTTRRGSQYSIESDEGGLRSREGEIPSQTASTQGSTISQRQVPEMSIIAEPEVELSRSLSHRNKSHSEVLDRHKHEPAQAVIHGVKGQQLGNVATNPSMSD